MHLFEILHNIIYVRKHFTLQGKFCPLPSSHFPLLYLKTGEMISTTVLGLRAGVLLKSGASGRNPGRVPPTGVKQALDDEDDDYYD